MVNNFEQIRELLDFKSDDDFYFLQILQRKKDNKKGTKVNGSNNNSRLVKAYYVKSVEHFDFIVPEVIELCNIFNARAGFNLNKRSFRKMALQHLKKVTDQLINGSYDKAHKAYSSVVGAFSNDTDKKWVLDIDDVDDVSSLLLNFINNCEPKSKTLEDSKIIALIPSKSGFHVITKPFNVMEFKKVYQEISIHKNNPTNLYIP
jgi:hypothetical protein